MQSASFKCSQSGLSIPPHPKTPHNKSSNSPNALSAISSIVAAHPHRYPYRQSVHLAFQRPALRCWLR
ncbi:hypothetical protein EJ04DRAFT_361927 [Polyplosphaeria fusca]|uniref:Uncharacterized protein n=1 Tax=Polyplosphaeria fusca TaxID=682080 RepID=A0A9P4V068_9PLEO|nr:hypothetical protein EJ04DRAFT_361927 [Polyplosphaeria fusca]